MGSEMTLKRTGDPRLLPVENNVADELRRRDAANVLNGAILLSGVKLVAGKDNPVAHKLGREAQGYHIARLNADARIYDSSARNPIPEKQLLLRTTADVTASLLVF